MRKSDPLDTLALAYALVINADRKVTHGEKLRFAHFIDTAPGLGTHLVQAAIPALEKALTLVRAETPERIVGKIAGRVETPADRDLVIGAARKAIVADAGIDDLEETVFGQLCSALGVDPATA